MSSKFIKHIYLLAVSVLIFTCSKKSVDLDYTASPENPVIITYSESREERIQNKWGSFLSRYKCSNSVKSADTVPISSYFNTISFESPYPKIFPNPFTEFTPEYIGGQLLVFYGFWEDLFGCSSANLTLTGFQPRPNYETIRVTFSQKKLSNRNYEFFLSTIIEFTVTKNGELISIISNLVPDVNLKYPDSCDTTKILNNIIGYEIEYLDLDIGEYLIHVISENDYFRVLPGFQIIEKRAENKLYVYCAKSVKVSLRNINNIIKLIFFCHPETSEIVYISGNDYYKRE